MALLIVLVVMTSELVFLIAAMVVVRGDGDCNNQDEDEREHA